MTAEQRLEKLENELAGLRTELSQRIETGSVTIRDENGKVRAKLGMDKRGPGLDLFDASGNIRVAVHAESDGRWALAIFDENGNDRAKLCLEEEGSALALFDENENKRAGLSLTEDGPGLMLLDQNEDILVQVAVVDEAGARPALTLFGGDGETIWQAS